MKFGTVKRCNNKPLFLEDDGPGFDGFASGNEKDKRVMRTVKEVIRECNKLSPCRGEWDFAVFMQLPASLQVLDKGIIQTTNFRRPDDFAKIGGEFHGLEEVADFC